MVDCVEVPTMGRQCVHLLRSGGRPESFSVPARTRSCLHSHPRPPRSSLPTQYSTHTAFSFHKVQYSSLLLSSFQR